MFKTVISFFVSEIKQNTIHTIYILQQMRYSYFKSSNNTKVKEKQHKKKTKANIHKLHHNRDKLK